MSDLYNCDHCGKEDHEISMSFVGDDFLCVYCANEAEDLEAEEGE